MAWYWTHDGQASHALRPPAAPFRVARVVAYGTGAARRFATLVHGDAGPARAVHLDLAAPEAAGLTDAVAVSASDGRFTVVTEPGRAVASRLWTGLAEAEVRGLLAAGERVLDLDGYATAGGPRFVVVTAPDGPGVSLLTGVTRWPGVRPVRIRALGGRCTVVGGDRTGGRGYAGLTADQVGRRLDRRGACPVDLDARATPGGVRFAVVLTTGG